MRIKIHGWVGRDGTLSFGLWTDRKGQDATDVGVLSDAMDHLPWKDIQYVAVEADLDMEAIFKDLTTEGEVTEVRPAPTEGDEHG